MLALLSCVNWPAPQFSQTANPIRRIAQCLRCCQRRISAINLEIFVCLLLASHVRCYGNHTVREPWLCWESVTRNGCTSTTVTIAPIPAIFPARICYLAGVASVCCFCQALSINCFAARSCECGSVCLTVRTVVTGICSAPLLPAHLGCVSLHSKKF